MTPAQIALNDLVATMTKLEHLLFGPGDDISDSDQKLIDKLEDRRASLERLLMDEVRSKLGIDYGTLWFAVTPSEPQGRTR